MQEREKWKWSHSVLSDSWRPHRLQPTRLLRPWASPDKSTGVGCHCLLHSSIISHGKCFQIYDWNRVENRICYMKTHFKFNFISTNPFHKGKYGSSTANKWNVPGISINKDCHGHQWLQPPLYRELVSPEGSLEEKITCHLAAIIASLIAQLVENPPAVQETLVWFLDWEDPLEKG